MSSAYARKSYSSRQTRTAGGVTKTDETTLEETRKDGEVKRKEEKSVRFDGLKISDSKDSRDHSTPGINRRSPKAVRDINDNKLEPKSEVKSDSKKTETKKEAKGAEAAVELKAEAARRRQKTTQSIEQRMLEQKQRKTADVKKRIQGRSSFKAQLEANAPKTNDGSQSSFKRTSSTNIDKLLQWAKNRTSCYPGVDIRDFSGSWADGLAFCALLHSLCPDEFKLDQMDENDRKINLDLAFKFASEQGVPALLETEDMLHSSKPEPRSIITYVHTIYKVLVQDKAEKEKEKKKQEEEAKK